MTAADGRETFSIKAKNEACQVRCRTVTERQACIAGAFCAAAPAGISFPSTFVRTSPQAAMALAGLLAQDGFVHLVRGGKVMVLEQSFASFCGLMSACFLKNAKEQLLLDRAFTKCFLRGAFLSAGYCADPRKFYRAELRISNDMIRDLICAMLESFDIRPSVSERDSYTLIYFKNGDMVSDFLGVIGATSCVMEFENIRAEKEVNSYVTKTVNCDSGNIKRSAEASARRSYAIDKIVRSGMKDRLPQELVDVIDAHYKNPAASIAELGAMMDPPIGKSGMNHRLKRIMEIADTPFD